MRLRRHGDQINRCRVADDNWVSDAVSSGREAAVEMVGEAVALLDNAARRVAGPFRRSGIDVDNVVGEVAARLAERCHGFVGRIGPLQLQLEAAQLATRLITRELEDRDPRRAVPIADDTDDLPPGLPGVGSDAGAAVEWLLTAVARVRAGLTRRGADRDVIRVAVIALEGLAHLPSIDLPHAIRGCARHLGVEVDAGTLTTEIRDLLRNL
jgi:hypothetical protein